ncbi:MAG: hypothetical protein ABIH00_03810 [Armatimonadota bacterium]
METDNKFISNFLILKIVLVIISLFAFLVKKDAVFFVAGFLVYSVSFLIYYFLNRGFNKEKPEGRQAFIALNPSFISTALVLIVLYYICKTVDISATRVPLLLFGLGLASDALFVVLAGRKMSLKNAVVNAASSMQSGFYLHIAVIFSVILGSYHFSGDSYLPLLPFYFTVFAFALCLVFSIIMNTGMKPSASNILHFVYAVLLLILGFFVVKMIVKDINYFYCIAAGIVSAFVISLVSCYNESEDKSINLSVLAVLILVGILWASFKFARGYGLSLCAVGFLADLLLLLPFMVYKYNNEEGSLFKNAVKVLTVAGFVLILVLNVRIFIQFTRLYEIGINLNNGYFIVGVMLGLFLPLIIEIDALFNPFKSSISRVSGLFFTGFNYIALLILAGFSIVCVTMFLGIEPLAAVLIGLIAAGAVSFIHLFKYKIDDPVWNTSLGSLWIIIGIAAYPVMRTLTPVLGDISRIQKIGMVLVLLLIVLVFYVAGGYSRKQA